MRKILLLALGTFALGVDAFIVAGLIPEIAAETRSTEAAVGQMVTAFTLCYAVSGPLLSSVLKANAKALLLIAIGIFTIGNIGSALADSLPTLLATRAIAGIGAGLYSPNAAATAAHLAPPEQRGRALSLILGGLSVGTVVGVPLGLFLAQSDGWRAAFWFVSAVGLLPAVGIAKFVPRLHISSPPTIKARLATLVDRRVTPVVAVSLLFNIASLGLYTYIAPVLQATAGVTNPTIYLWVWGIGGIVGSFAVGPMIDRAVSATRVMPAILGLFVVATGTIAAAGALTALVALALACWGAAGFASPPPQQHLLLERAPDLGTVAVAVNSSAIYLGSAIGTALGGIALNAGLSPKDLPYAASALAALATLVYVTVVIPADRRARP
jgi:predicted MFS family arabinose efflux permease